MRTLAEPAGRPVAAIACLLAVLGAARPARADSDAKAVALVNRADRVFQSQSSASVVDMEIKTARYQRQYKIVTWQQGDDRVLVKILGPARYRGSGTLKLGSQLKLYDPRSNQVTVVGSSMLGDSWMGSHFNNDDLVHEMRLARDFEVTLARTWTGAAPDGRQVTFHRSRLTPRPSAPIAWGRIEYQLWDDGHTVLPVRADYYRRAGDATPQRTLTFSALKTLGGRLLPSEMTATVAGKPGEYTRLRYTTVGFDVQIPASKFTEQALRK